MTFIEIGNHFFRLEDIKSISKTWDYEREWDKEKDRLKRTGVILYGYFVENYNGDKYKSKEFKDESERDASLNSIKIKLNSEL